VVLYDKRRPTDRLAEMRWIDYALSVLTRDLIEDRLKPGAVADIADLLHDVSIRGKLAGLEVDERFYEVGSAAGLDTTWSDTLAGCPSAAVFQRMKTLK
jgi:hypothetical protein